jgi:hypothetical protein
VTTVTPLDYWDIGGSILGRKKELFSSPWCPDVHRGLPEYSFPDDITADVRTYAKTEWTYTSTPPYVFLA